MTDRYAIVAFPIFNAPGRVEAVRRRFDPLAGTLNGHITLVFPFEDAAEPDWLHPHMSAVLADVGPFTVTFTDPSVEEDAYLFLNVLEGRRQVIDLHDRLYSGRLARHLSRDHEYRPHLTVGHLPSSESPEALMAVSAEVRAELTPPIVGRIDSLALFRLENDARGSIQFEVSHASLI